MAGFDLPGDSRNKAPRAVMDGCPARYLRTRKNLMVLLSLSGAGHGMNRSAKTKECLNVMDRVIVIQNGLGTGLVF